MDTIKSVETKNGFFIFKLGQLLDENNVSINQLMRDTNTDFKVLKRLITGDIIRIDLIVLARLCDYFNVDITSIIEYRTK